MAVTGGTRHIVGGVDTHKDLHVAAVVDEQDRVIGTRSFATTRQGYRQMLAWMRSFGELQRIGIGECQLFCVRGFHDRLVSSRVIVPPLESDRQTG
jgi:Transposase